MASAPQPQLPLFYNELTPLSSKQHQNFRTRASDTAEWLVNQHVVPLTVDEFIQAQRYYPIVFSSGDNPMPLALMGLNEGVNTFVSKEGRFEEPVYVPAYIRRYPFMLARLKADSEQLSLCFDPTAKTIGAFDEGNPLFEGDQPSETTQAILKFCEQFEQAGQRTRAFFDELKKHDLLMDGEMAITQAERGDKPFVYRGFKMVNQEKLRELRGDILRGWNQNGLLPIIFAHLFSLELMRNVFARQAQRGLVPQPDMAPAS
jgi:hypothetical protein